MVYLNVLGQPIVIINSHQIAIDLFEKRSSKYSDRPRMVVGGEMIGWDQSLVLSPYGERFRDIRRLMHQFIGTEKLVSNFSDVQEQEAKRFLRRLADKPTKFEDHVKKYVRLYPFPARSDRRSLNQINRLH